MKELRNKSFKNDVVYCLQLEDGFLVKTIDTFLAYYTKDAIGRHQNKLNNNELGDHTERWMIALCIRDYLKSVYDNMVKALKYLEDE